MSGWELIKFLKKIGGYTKCTSWKHGQANCKRKQARQNQLGSKGKFDRTNCKTDSRSGHHNSTGRSVHKNRQPPSNLTRLMVQQLNACGRTRADKKAKMGMRSMTIRVRDEDSQMGRCGSPSGQHGSRGHCNYHQRNRPESRSSSYRHGFTSSSAGTQKLRVRSPLRRAFAHPAVSQYHLRDVIRKPVLSISAMGRHVDAHIGSPELHLCANSHEGQLPNPRRQGGSREGRSRTGKGAQGHPTTHLAQVFIPHLSIDGVQGPIGEAHPAGAGAGCANSATQACTEVGSGRCLIMWTALAPVIP